jgi:hypothetical protein
MANPIDVIKSYLVSIGFSTDQNTYQKSKEVLKNMEAAIRRVFYWNRSGKNHTYKKYLLNQAGSLLFY